MAPSALIFTKLVFAETQQAEICILNFTQIGQEIHQFYLSWLDIPKWTRTFPPLRIGCHTQTHETRYICSGRVIGCVGGNGGTLHYSYFQKHEASRKGCVCVSNLYCPCHPQCCHFMIVSFPNNNFLFLRTDMGHKSLGHALIPFCIRIATCLQSFCGCFNWSLVSGRLPRLDSNGTQNILPPLAANSLSMRHASCERRTVRTVTSHAFARHSEPSLLFQFICLQ